MKQSRFSEQQIAFILKQFDDGIIVEEVCRKAGISQQTYYRWRKKYGGLMPSELKRLKQLEEENNRLKRMVADLSLDKAMLQVVLSKKLESRRLSQVGLRKRIREIAEIRVRYGYRRIHILFRREGWRVNAKLVCRLYVEEGLQIRNKRPKRKVSAKLREDRKPPQGPNDVWAID